MNIVVEVELLSMCSYVDVVILLEVVEVLAGVVGGNIVIELLSNGVVGVKVVVSVNILEVMGYAIYCSKLNSRAIERS